MAGRRALVAIFSLSAACLPGQSEAEVSRSVVAALVDEATVETSATCSSGSGDCKQEDNLALLQHASLKKQPVKAHVSHQDSTLDASEQHQSSEALPRSLLSTPGLEQPKMLDVLGAFKDLSSSSSDVLRINLGRAFPSGYNKGVMPYSEHFQGIQRQQNSSYLYISGSGETENMGQVFVAELASRPSTGGALGSNDVVKWGRSMGPPKKDVVKKEIKVDGQYWHAGGATSFGDYLAVGAEAGCSSTERFFGTCALESRIHFYDTSDPAKPKKLPYVVERPTASAGAVALTQQEDGTFLLMVGRVDSEILDFYVSKGKSLASNPHFKLVKTWYKDSLLAAPGQYADFGQYQNLHFVRQTDGKLFMLGTYRTSNGLGDDYADLFTVDASVPRRLSIKKVGSEKLTCQSGTCNFQAGAGVYVDSETTMMLYATNWEPADNTIYVNEFTGKDSTKPSKSSSGNNWGGKKFSWGR